MTPSTALSKDSSEAVYNKLSQIESTLMSPYCPGLLLRDCPSPAATELKEEIRTELSHGKSVQEIEDALFARFGEAKLRSAPPMRGVGLLAWVVPLGVFLIGITIVVFRLFRAHGNKKSL